MSNRYELHVTSDGAHTVYDRQLKSHYHSIHGAVRESKHVFIEAGLSYFHSLNLKQSQYSILEVGFGAGLRAMLAWSYAERWRICIDYEAIEPNPLPEELYRQLNYAAWASEIRFMSIHEARWGRSVQLSDYFSIRKQKKSWPTYKSRRRFNLVFYDPFSPDVHPEAWQNDALASIYNHLHNEGILVTYSAQSNFRRRAEAYGFKTELLRGAPGKRHMIRATRNNS